MRLAGFRPGEEWKRYDLAAGVLPTAAEMANTEGWIVTGSAHDAHSNDEWVERLRNIVREVRSLSQLNPLGSN